MEKATHTAISDRLIESYVPLRETTARRLEEARDRLTLEEAIDIYPYDDTETAAIFECLGLSEVPADRVLAYQYISTYYDPYNTNDETNVASHDVVYEESKHIGELLAEVGNVGLANEFVNNFNAGLAIALDEETVVYVSQEVFEQTYVCNDCDSSESVYDVENSSCEHENDEVVVSHSIHIRNHPHSIEEIEGELLLHVV